jgi:hypothetical protein
MSERLVNVDRETPMLLPADLRTWVPEDDLVHFVIPAVPAGDDAAAGVEAAIVPRVPFGVKGARGKKQYQRAQRQPRLVTKPNHSTKIELVYALFVPSPASSVLVVPVQKQGMDIEPLL